MAFTINQFKAALINAKSDNYEENIKNKAVSPKDIIKKQLNTAKKAGKAIRGVMPVTNNRFESMVEMMNNKHNNNEREIWKNRFRAEMIANAIGVNLPSEEELDALYEEYTAGPIVEEEPVVEEAQEEVYEESPAQEEVEELAYDEYEEEEEIVDDPVVEEEPIEEEPAQEERKGERRRRRLSYTPPLEDAQAE